MTVAAPDPDARLVFDADGNLEIEDHDGRVITYLWEVAPPGLDDWRVILRRLDAKAGPYEVTRTPGGRYRCTCKDSLFGARKRGTPCKHRVMCQRLYAVARRLNNGSQDEEA